MTPTRLCICGHPRSRHFDARKENVDELNHCYDCDCMAFKTKKTRKQLEKLVEHIRRNW